MKTGKYERTPEHNAANSKSKKGIPRSPLSPEHYAALSEIMRNSKAHKAASERKRGGNDLVWHHVSYDFGRPNALRVRITRKFHAKIHNPKGLGIHQRGYSFID